MSYRAAVAQSRRPGGATRSFPFGHWPNLGFEEHGRSQGPYALLPGRVSSKRISADCFITCTCSGRWILRLNFRLHIMQRSDLLNEHALDSSSCLAGNARIGSELINCIYLRIPTASEISPEPPRRAYAESKVVVRPNDAVKQGGQAGYL